MHPRQILDTSRPVLPSFTYSIVPLRGERWSILRRQLLRPNAHRGAWRWLEKSPVFDRCDFSQFFRRAGAEPEEFQVGGNHLEQHVRSNLNGAAAFLRRPEQRRIL